MKGLLDNTGEGKGRVTRRSSGEDWVRRVLIAMACLWLLVGVVLPLLDVVNRATHIELVVKIEEPTAQEKLEDDFRGQVNIAGQTVLFMKEDGENNTLYITNKPVELLRNKADLPGPEVSLHAVFDFADLERHPDAQTSSVVQLLHARECLASFDTNCNAHGTD